MNLLMKLRKISTSQNLSQGFFCTYLAKKLYVPFNFCSQAHYSYFIQRDPSSFLYNPSRKFQLNKFSPFMKFSKKEPRKDEDVAPEGFEKFKRKKTIEPKKAPIDHSSNKDKGDQKPARKAQNQSNNDDDGKGNNDKNDKNDNKNTEESPKEKFWRFLFQNLGLIITTCGIGYYIFISSDENKEIREIYSNEFVKLVEQKQIKSIDIAKDKTTISFFNIYANLKDGTQVKLNINNYDKFVQDLEKRQKDLNVNEIDFIPLKLMASPPAQKSESTIMNISGWFMFWILTYILFRRYSLTFSKALKGKTKGLEQKGGKTLDAFKGFNDLFDYTKSGAQEYGMGAKVKIKFKHVAGMDQPKKEVMEFVDFLKFPEKYRMLGARVPRGALIVGPPGTGKTLLAKAVAGEASVPFFAISGSEFVEMFVGVGAARVRDLFKKAKDKAPCIVFIDEIDAVGRKRGGKFSGGHDERDSTLNQLLVEMDGFGTDSKVIVLAATNRSDILDHALLRPGRFDRQVEVSLPDRKEREEIFKIYLHKVKLDESKTVEEYATRLSTLTPGFSGADISNLVNEAAIISARDNKEHVDSESFEKATDRTIAGLETKKLLSEKERKIIAYHESGHAVVSWFLEHSSPLVKLTIIPRSKGALGFTQFVPDDVYLRTKEHLYDLICSLLGGRISEEVFFGSITTGAADDLQKVSQIANAMVTKYGMSKLGLSSYSSIEDPFSVSKPYSPKTEALIEQEMSSIINECAEITKKLATQHKDHIEKLAKELLEKETLDLMDIIRILGDRPFPLSDSMKDYMKEIELREKKKKEEEKAKENGKDKEIHERNPTNSETKKEL